MMFTTKITSNIIIFLRSLNLDELKEGGKLLGEFVQTDLIGGEVVTSASQRRNSSKATA